MKKQYLLTLAAFILSAFAAFSQAVTIAKWTFETSQPGVVTLPAIPGPGVFLTNVVAEVGSGTAAGWHSGFGTPTYSSPAGNGSSHSFSANGWTNNPGDFYQFAVSTLGYTNIVVTFDSVSSATGPRDFYFAYSTDGINFTQFGGIYTNGNSPVWSSGSVNPAYSHTNDLSSVTGLTNQPVVYFRLVDASTNASNGSGVGTAGTSRVDNFTVTGTSYPNPPLIESISPASVTTNAGSTVAFALTANSGNPAASNYWYKITGSTTNLIPSATTTILTLNNVLAADTASYFAVLSNSYGMATSDVVSLTVIDPAILIQPASAFGLLDGPVQFFVTAAGSSLSYQWYFCTDPNDNTAIASAVSNGPRGSGSVVSGANTSTLTITNLQLADPTNFVVVVIGGGGSVTSSVASLLSVGNQATLAFWNFNLPSFPNTVSNPAPWFGVGTASATNCTTFSGATDPADGPGFGLGDVNYSWGTTTYPLTGSNKQCGVQFNVSTVGAKNIAVSYDSRVSATASDYERLQYTTNGTDWVDYPSSSTFNGQFGTGNAGYFPFSYNLAGFPGVANNPNFGIRVVTEYQNTATYGIGTTNNYVGTANNYGTSGTVTYDIVNVSGYAITNNNTPPTITSFINTNMVDTNTLTLNLTVGDVETSAGALTLSAASLNPSKVNPTFNFGGSGASRTMTISFPPSQFIPDPIDAAPILVTVKDGNGDTTATWFLLTVGSINLPPTNSLVPLGPTNVLANRSITIPFTVGDDHTPVSGLTYGTNSNNNTLVPNSNIVVNGIGTANPSVTITPAPNQEGVAVVSVTVYDNDVNEPRGTTANIALMVRPNTNVVAIDYFNYDISGSLDTVSGGFWTHLSGPFGQMGVGSGVAVVDTSANTENLQTPLLGGPYKTNSGAILYSSFIVNMNPNLDPLKMPRLNGTYFALFNDGSGVTGPYECRVVAATNGAAPGFYQLGINNFGADWTTAQMFPQDLSPNSNYVVVTALSLTNGLSTIWINPVSQSSLSVTDTTPAPNVTNLYNIAAFELRESGVNGGLVNFSHLKVGTTFDSVFPSLQVLPAGTNVIVNWSDPALGIQSTTNLLSPFTDVSGASPPYTNNASTNSVLFFRFKP